MIAGQRYIEHNKAFGYFEVSCKFVVLCLYQFSIGAQFCATKPRINETLKTTTNNR